MKKIEIKLNEKTFPKKMITEDGLIVMFAAKNIGMVIESNTINFEVGHYDETWNMSYFKDIEEEKKCVKPFPKLMISDNFIVYFEKERCGYDIINNDYSDCYNMDYFKDVDINIIY